MAISWDTTRVVARAGGPEGLVWLHLEAERPFKAGQFMMLGKPVDDDVVGRAYSIASAPGEPMCFVIAEVPNGALSPELIRLEPGDEVKIGTRAAGSFTLDGVEPAGVLLCIATGTGIAPFLSMARDPSTGERFDRIVIVHGVRVGADLRWTRETLAETDVTIVPCVTREAPPEDGLAGRVTTLLSDGTLEKRLGFTIETDDVHVLLCGAPAMVENMTEQLEARGYSRHRRRQPGRLQHEAY